MLFLLFVPVWTSCRCFSMFSIYKLIGILPQLNFRNNSGVNLHLRINSTSVAFPVHGNSTLEFSLNGTGIH